MFKLSVFTVIDSDSLSGFRVRDDRFEIFSKCMNILADSRNYLRLCNVSDYEFCSRESDESHGNEARAMISSTKHMT